MEVRIMPIDDFYPVKEIFKEDFSWKLTIESVHNGFILNMKNDDGNPVKIVLEEDDKYSENNGSEIRNGKKLLLEIINYFNLYKSEHERYKLEVKIKDNTTEEYLKD